MTILQAWDFWAGISYLHFLLQKNSTRKMAFFHAWDFSGWKMVIFRVQFFSKPKLKIWHPTPKMTILQAWDFWAGISYLHFLLQKNSTRKMAFFQAWDFSGWKMVIFRVEFALENGLFPGWNLPWKMAIFQVGICPGKWPFSRLGFVRMREIK